MFAKPRNGLCFAPMPPRVTLPFLVLAFAACGPRDPFTLPDDGRVRALFDPAATGFFDQPWPLDSRRDGAGRPLLDGWPQPGSSRLLQAFLDTASVDEGFSTAGASYVRFSGDLDPSTLPATPAASLSDGSTVFLVDLDDPRLPKVPLRVVWQAREEAFRPGRLLQALPVQGWRLREGTRHALVVTTGVRDDAGRPLGAHPLFRVLVDGAMPDTTRPLAAAYQPLIDRLEALSLAPESIAMATVFTTNRPTATLARAAALAWDGPPVPIRDFSKSADFPAFCVFSGIFDMPQFQQGEKPFPREGQFEFDADGRAIEVRREAVPFVVTIPRAPRPEAGYPLLSYLHGTGGLATQVVHRGPRCAQEDVAPEGSGPASMAAAFGGASVGHALPRNPERDPGTASDVAFYNVENPRALRDTFRQAALEVVLVLRTLASAELDTSACEGAAPVSSFDDDRFVLQGQSLGGHVAAIASGVAPRLAGTLLTGTGGSFIHAMESTVPLDLGALVRLLLDFPAGEALDPVHPVLTLYQWALEGADVPGYAALAAEAGRHALFLSGEGDRYFSPAAQDALTLALGADAGPEDPLLESLQPLLEAAGRRVATYPVARNAAGATRLAVRYPAHPAFTNNHYTAFSYQGAVDQRSAFVRDLFAGQPPTLPAGGPAHVTCVE